jgi:hypothetical protein
VQVGTHHRPIDDLSLSTYGEDLKRFYFEAFNKLTRLALVYSARSLPYAHKCYDIHGTCVTVLESLHPSDATQAALVNKFIHNANTR